MNDRHLPEGKYPSPLLEQDFINSACWKFAEWEMRGIPLRLEIGPKEVKGNQTVAVRRDNKIKKIIKLDSLSEEVIKILDEIQRFLFKEALKFQLENTQDKRGNYGHNPCYSDRPG